MWLSAGYELHAEKAVPWHMVISAYLLGMSSMLRKLSPHMWLSAGYELHSEEAVPCMACGYQLGMSSILMKLSPTCGYLERMSAMLRKLSTNMWVSTKYECHAKEAVPQHVVICQVRAPS
jgi:hypothetical protein